MINRERIQARLMKFSWSRASIWGDDAIPANDERVAGLLRVTLPLLDLILFLFGLAALIAGLPVFAEFFVAAITVIFGVLVCSSAFAAFIGLCFRWSRVEVIAKVALAALLVVYPATLLLSGTVNSARLAAGVLCCVAIPFLYWRLRDLGRERGLKK